MVSNKDRVAWVTGGGSGIGQAGAESLAADGWTVVISGRRKDVLDTVVKGINTKGGNAETLAVDVSNAGDVNHAAEHIVAKHGRIDVLVNSAGLNIKKRSWNELEIEGWNDVVNVDLNGTMYCMHAVLPTMRAQRDGCIINVASWASYFITKTAGGAYSAAKHAVLALTRSFNMEECVNGLRACCLSPGEVATPLLKQRPQPVSDEDMARMLRPEDLGRTIVFVANMPPHVCVNEILISPTWNRALVYSV
jgi:NADP-dependent 3-hydroxy acid dehydrogenase YdfG